MYIILGTADDCQPKDSVTKISDFQDIPKENEAAMIAAVDKQPVATAMHMLVCFSMWKSVEKQFLFF